MDPEPARLVGGGGDHTAGARPPDEHRLAAQARIVEHLDGGVEGVEVDVEDRAAPAPARGPFFRRARTRPFRPHHVTRTNASTMIRDDIFEWPSVRSRNSMGTSARTAPVWRTL